MQNPLKTSFPHKSRTSGFTLVEMLVAVSLVLLIMLLLAEIFSLAAGSALKQKGTAENDQQARTFTTILQGDICARSFRKVIPFRPLPAGVDVNTLFPDAQGDGLELRRGYFCISENDPSSAKDDVLSFTVDYESNNQNCVYADTSGVRARAVILGGSTNVYLYNNPNQPEHDDGFPVQNESGLSNTAEVCYYLRNGNLHRRVMLLRDQYATTGTNDGQPTDGGGSTPLVTGDYPGTYSPNGSGVFWRDFDYSALYHLAGTPPRPFFLVGSSDILTVPSCLDNNETTGFMFDFGMGANPVPMSIAIPHFRFGHDIQDANLGRAREFLNEYRYQPLATPAAATGEQNFIGRYTTQETADADFTYPGNVTNGNPMRPADPTVGTLAFDNDGVVDRFNDINRRGDDILLTNVIEFDIKVWDDVLNRFLNLGHSARDGAGNPVGHYNIANNNSYNDNDSSGDLTVNFNATTQKYELAGGDTLRYGNTYDTSHWFEPLGQPPYRPTYNGPDLAPGVVGVNDDGDAVTDYDSMGVPDAGEQGWIGSDDEIPLKAIEITIRYTDPSSGLVRQVTLLNSLLD